MRTVIQSTLISVDGVTNNPGEWALPYFDDEFHDEAAALMNRSDAMVMGRGIYEDLSWRWPSQTGVFADAINGIRKYVFSAQLEEAEWNNSVIVRADAVAEIARLKEEGGKDLVLFGHGKLGTALLEAGLIDELRFSVIPVVVGDSHGSFTHNPKTPLTLVGSHVRRSG
ncbi:dihydrofolate reductase family protein, partial [Actinomycetes bacterium KLBMP 9759]